MPARQRRPDDVLHAEQLRGEEILIVRGGFEQCALFLRIEFTGAVPEQQGLRIETARLAHSEGPPTFRSNARKHRRAIS